MINKILIYPSEESFENILELVDQIEEVCKRKHNNIEVYLIASQLKSTRVAARLFGFSFVETSYSKGRINYMEVKQYGKKRAYIKCYAEEELEAREALESDIAPDIIVYGMNNDCGGHTIREIIEEELLLKIEN